MDNTALNEFMPIIIEMMRDPPDPNKPLPLTNRLSGAVGISMPFLVTLSLAMQERVIAYICRYSVSSQLVFGFIPDCTLFTNQGGTTSLLRSQRS